MCTDELHNTRQLELLTKIASDVTHIKVGRKDEEQTFLLSSNTPYIVDYKDRKHVYAFCLSSFAFTVEDLGSFNVTAGEWVYLKFPEGYRLYPIVQSNNKVVVFVRCTDNLISSAGAGSSSNPQSSITVSPFPGNPTQTGVGADTTFAWGNAGNTQVSTLFLQNKTVNPVYYAFDSAASPGTYQLLPGELTTWNRSLTVLHLYTAAAVNINGATTPNIVVEGAL